jgi:hypothetical protein
MRLAFIACVERGHLEAQTILLCRSIRRFGGGFRDAAIHTFEPRIGHAIAPATRRVLEELGVVHHVDVLNRSFVDQPVVNKVFACARAEESLDEEVLVFLDSDTVVIGEPDALDLPSGIDVALRPAYSAGLNSSGPGHPMDAYWRGVYEFFGIDNARYVETELGTITRAYYSAGLIAARREAGFFGRWRSIFLELVCIDRLPESGISRADEIALAVAALEAKDRVRSLDGGYNYLIFRRAQLAAPWDRAQLEAVVHVHYRGAFAEPGFLRSLCPPLDANSAVLNWLEQHLPLAATVR